MFTRSLASSILIVSCAAAGVAAQASMQPTPPPAVTAETQDWYLSGGPIAYGGSTYYPAGAITHFLRNEMVMTGLFGSVPIYVRTTQEPGSVIYVPLPGGLVQPYERRRTGDLAGTVGSSAPGFPVALRGTEPTAFAQTPPEALDRPVGTSGFYLGGPAAPSPAPEPIATTGVAPAIAPGPRPPATPLATARRPSGINAVFLQYDNTRWLASGPAVELESKRLTRIGDYHGFPVYAEEGQRDTIYVSLLEGAPGLVTPYTAR